MRRALTISLITLALFVSAAGAAHIVHAQSESQDSTDAAGTANNAPAAPTNVVNPTTSGQNIPVTQPAATDTTGIFASVMIFIMKLFAWLVGIAAITLDNAVYYTVVNMGSYVNKLSAVGVAWRILRDLANIMLIFGFLGAGIMTILGIDLYGWSTKMLPKLLIAAVLINFSLFVSEAMIDGTNLVSTEIYTQINGGNPAGAKNFDSISSVVNAGNDGIAGKIMSQLGLQTIYGRATTNNGLLDFAGAPIIGFMSILLFLITAFVMFSLAFILIARFVVLILLILVSPVAFMGWAVPWLGPRMNQWWENFTQQIITAPVLLLLLYVALAVITDAKFLTGFGSSTSPDWTGFIPNNGVMNLTGFGSVMLSFFVAMGLLMVVVIKAKSMSAAGANLATKGAGKLTFGATAWAGRRTVGRASNYAARKIRSSAIGRTETGRLLAGFADKGAKGSFDLRGTKAMGNLKGYVDVGAAQKGGYKATQDAGIKARTKYAEELKGKELTKDQKVRQTLLQNEIKKLNKSKENALSEEQIKAANAEIEKREKELEEIEKVTDKGAKLKYTGNLLFGKDENSFFNKYVNPNANTDAAKNIKKEAKKSKSDKDMEKIKKFVEKGNEDEPGGGGKEEKKESGSDEKKSPVS